MRLRFKEFEDLAKRKGYRTDKILIKRMGGGDGTLSCLKAGCRIGDELVKNIYNAFGEYETTRVIDFEEDSINGLKAKYIQIGNKLY